MTVFIMVFGTLTCLTGVVILFNPKLVFEFLAKYVNKIGIQITAVGIRLMLGVFLVYQSDASRYPRVIEIIGWLSIIAALFFAAIGRKKFVRIRGWVETSSNVYVFATVLRADNPDKSFGAARMSVVREVFSLRAILR